MKEFGAACIGVCLGFVLGVWATRDVEEIERQLKEARRGDRD